MFSHGQGLQHTQTTVIFCRHGETEWNLMKKFQGSIDIPLNEAGSAQAEQLAKSLQVHDLAAVVASPLKRACQTGQAIAGAAGLQVRVDERLRERELGIMQGLTAKEVRMKHPDVWRAWKTQQAFPAAAEVEPGPEVVARTESVLFDLARQYPGRTVAVVGHGAAIRCILCRAVGNGSITVFTIGPGRSWRLNLQGLPRHVDGVGDWGPDPSVATLILCGHGDTDWSVARRFQGTTDMPLNEVGRRHAGLIATALTRLAPGSIWCSPLRRAQATGCMVARSCGVQLNVDPRLCERHLGVMQGRTRADLKTAYPAVLNAFEARVPFPEEAQVEPEQELVARMESVLGDIAATHAGKLAAVIMHAATFSCLFNRALEPSTTAGDVCMATLLVDPSRRWRLVRIGDADGLRLVSEERQCVWQPPASAEPDAISFRLSAEEAAQRRPMQSRL